MPSLKKQNLQKKARKERSRKTSISSRKRVKTGRRLTLSPNVSIEKKRAGPVTKQVKSGKKGKVAYANHSYRDIEYHLCKIPPLAQHPSLGEGYTSPSQMSKEELSEIVEDPDFGLSNLSDKHLNTVYAEIEDYEVKLMAFLETLKRADPPVKERTEFLNYMITTMGEEPVSQMLYEYEHTSIDNFLYTDKIQKLSDEQLLSPLLNVLKKEDMYTEEISRMISKLSKEQLNMFHTCHPVLYPNEENVSKMARDEINKRKEKEEKEDLLLREALNIKYYIDS